MSKYKTDPNFCPLSGTFFDKEFQRRFRRAGISGRYRAVSRESAEQAPEEVKRHFGLDDEQKLVMGLRVPPVKEETPKW